MRFKTCQTWHVFRRDLSNTLWLLPMYIIYLRLKNMRIKRSMALASVSVLVWSKYSCDAPVVFQQTTEPMTTLNRLASLNSLARIRE
jgi:hypothetical protein